MQKSCLTYCVHFFSQRMHCTESHQPNSIMTREFNFLIWKLFWASAKPLSKEKKKNFSFQPETKSWGDPVVLCMFSTQRLQHLQPLGDATTSLSSTLFLWSHQAPSHSHQCRRSSVRIACKYCHSIIFTDKIINVLLGNTCLKRSQSTWSSLSFQYQDFRKT